MSQVSQLSPELGRGVLQLARALVAAAQHWTLYPPDHPAVGQALSRLALAIGQNSSGNVFSIGVFVNLMGLLVETVDSDAIDIDPLTHL
jgi:hypothetical protein